MCGIAGILKVHPARTPLPAPEVAIPESWLDVLDESIKHRGPDGQGRFRDRAVRPDGTVVDVAFVHRRLSIIDIAGGQQPMVSERGPHADKPRNGRVAVVFNGCIYNHRDLRRELQAAGHRFVTDHSDTEVLVHGWREWGHKLFAKLDGMFAVALWDAATATLVLSRDRFGEKPLCFDESNERLGFCSGFDGLLRLRGASGQRRGVFDIHQPTLIGWLAFGWAAGPTHMSTQSVPMGISRVWGRTDATQESLFKSAQDFYCEKALPRETSIQPSEVDLLLRDAVRSRLQADVPIGVFLSGGLDSGLVANYAMQAAPELQAFTVRMPLQEFDESDGAALTAKSLGIRHHVLECSPSPASDLVTAIRELGLPFGDSSLLPTIWVNRAARQSVPVALGGDGGDELFLGYERHRVIRALATGRRLPASLRRFLGAIGVRHVGSMSRRTRHIARFFCALNALKYADLLAIFPRDFLDHVVSRGSEAATSQQFAEFAIPADLNAAEFEGMALSQDLGDYLPQDLLRKTDTASMSFALEMRAPFLARELVDRMIRVRPDVLMPNGERKGLLKAVARKYLPEQIVNRPKMGFSIPIGEWFRTDYGGMKQLLLDTLNSADPFPEDLLGIKINREFVAKMVSDHMERRRDHAQRLYMLLVLAIWAEWLRGISRGN
ncbi:MAG: asparagine synthase (glutamine-hydrolyzing) [Phycisphaerales bacterium]